jgi:phage repressor protein C with HTH and peptisase S24 domain
VAVQYPVDRQQLAQKLDQMGRGSRAALAKHLGVHQSVVSKLLHRKRRLTVEENAKIEEFLNLEDAPNEVAPSPSHNSVMFQPRQTRQHGALIPPLVQYRTARADPGGSGAFVLYQKEAGSIPRDARVEHSENAFCCKVLDDANDPAFRAGDMIVVDPDTPAIKDNYCVFVNDPRAPEGSPALIAELLSTTDTHWIVKILTQRHEQRLARKVWPNAWPIVVHYPRR